jgi:hypothetical protein
MAAHRDTIGNPLAPISPGGGWENKLYPPELWGWGRRASARCVLPPWCFGVRANELADAVVHAWGVAKRAPETSILNWQPA